MRAQRIHISLPGNAHLTVDDSAADGRGVRIYVEGKLVYDMALSEWESPTAHQDLHSHGFLAVNCRPQTPTEDTT